MTSALATAGVTMLPVPFLDDSTHLIDGRPTNRELTLLRAAAYRTGEDITLTVDLKGDEGYSWDIIVTSRFTHTPSGEIHFTGLIANGSSIVKVKVVFRGEKRGSFRIISRLTP